MELLSTTQKCRAGLQSLHSRLPTVQESVHFTPHVLQGAQQAHDYNGHIS
jgi:hypothetical protein